jgi:hypothetical protein
MSLLSSLAPSRETHVARCTHRTDFVSIQPTSTFSTRLYLSICLPILSYLILSYLIWSCLILSYLVLSYLIFPIYLYFLPILSFYIIYNNIYIYNYIYSIYLDCLLLSFILYIIVIYLYYLSTYITYLSVYSLMDLSIHMINLFIHPSMYVCSTHLYVSIYWLIYPSSYLSIHYCNLSISSRDGSPTAQLLSSIYTLRRNPALPSSHGSSTTENVTNPLLYIHTTVAI